MHSIMREIAGYRALPGCCIMCDYLDYNQQDPTYGEAMYPFCEIGIFFPTKKQSCKRRKWGKLRGSRCPKPKPMKYTSSPSSE